MAKVVAPERMTRFHASLSSDEEADAKYLEDRVKALARPASCQPPVREETLKRLAVESPDKFLDWIASDSLNPAQLSFAAEAASEMSDSSRAVPVLLELLGHESPLVREGAVYGLESHSGIQGVREKLLWVAKNDQSPGVREAANEVFEE